MSHAMDIPAISFTKEQYDKVTKTITINLNECLWLHRLFEDHRLSHRRLLPQIRVLSPSGSIVCFDFPRHEGADIVFEAKDVSLKLIFA